MLCHAMNAVETAESRLRPLQPHLPPINHLQRLNAEGFVTQTKKLGLALSLILRLNNNGSKNGVSRSVVLHGTTTHVPGSLYVIKHLMPVCEQLKSWFQIGRHISLA